MTGPAKLGIDQGPTRKRRIAEGFFLLLCLETIFSVMYRAVFLTVHSMVAAWFVGLCVCAAGILLSIRWSAAILSRLRVLAIAARGRRRLWPAFWLVVGLALRLAWAWMFRGSLKADGLVYYAGGKSLALEHRFAGALWPPGFSLFLAPFFMVLGAHVWVTVFCALLLFALTYWAIYRLADHLPGGSAALLAPMLLAVWPTDIALTGVNCKETLLALLLTCAMLLYLEAETPDGTIRLPFIAGAGLVLGFCALTQPGYILFPAVLLGYELLRKQGLRRAIWRTAVLSVGLTAAILPWTYRNYRTFHRAILISTNGGSVFYRANNSKANAAYLPEDEVDLPKDDFAANEQGYREGRDWIAHHPLAFARLMVRKQVGFLGDDGTGVYESMKRDQRPSALEYNLAKAISNLFWLACWVILLLGAPALFRSTAWPVWYGLCFLPLVYQWAVDSVFESGARHHITYIGLICVMVGLVLQPEATSPEDQEPAGSTVRLPLFASTLSS